MSWHLDEVLADVIGDGVDQIHRDQDHDDDQRRLIPGQHPDAVRQLKSDSAGTHNTQDGGRSRVGFEIIQGG